MAAMPCGTVSDQPWGLTLSSLAGSRSSGQLTLTADDGKLYCVAFDGGAVVGASSPLASDSAARVALTSHLVSSSQVPALARAVAAAPGRDEVEVVAEAAHLTREQAAHLRRRLLVQRVARTFSVERGGYVFGERVTVASMQGIEIDVGPAIFRGVRMNLSQDRLDADLRHLGARFVLRAEAAEELDGARFGFTEHERPILAALRIGTSLSELEATRRDLEPRLTQAVIYTLVAAGLCDGLAAAAVAVAVAPALEVVDVDVVDDEDDEVAIARARTTTYDGPRRGVSRSDPPRTRTISSVPPAILRQSNAFATREVIASGIALLEVHADHFALLGLPHDATTESICAAYVSLACHLHPDKLPALDPAATRDAQRLFARVNLAYGVLGDPVRRAAYVALLRGEAGPGPGPGPAPGPRSPSQPEPRAGTATERARAAAEVAQRGMRALRREDLLTAVELLTRATELAPHDVDYGAQLAWARFCASTDKAGIAAGVRRALERAISKSSRPVTARFYLGRVERMLGRVREALHHFHEVIQLDPSHAEAAAEIRMLEPRTARR
jgi:hypothetical protein